MKILRCPATMKYYVTEGMLFRELLAGCELLQEHEGNHLTTIDGKERVFPRLYP